MDKIKNVVKDGQEKYEIAISRVKPKSWSSPMGKVMSVSGHILKYAGKAGVPFTGILGSALVGGSKILNLKHRWKILVKLFKRH